MSHFQYVDDIVIFRLGGGGTKYMRRWWLILKTILTGAGLVLIYL